VKTSTPSADAPGNVVRIALTNALMLASLAGCSLLQPTRSPVAPPERTIPNPIPEAPKPSAAPATPPPAPAALPATPTAPPPPAREYHLNPATQSLVAQAHSQIARGELPGAATTLDRALRIEPQNPLLWIELARLRLTENDGRQAESCARKALALGGLDPQTRSKAGHALVDALRLLHREPEARELEAQPWMK